MSSTTDRVMVFIDGQNLFKGLRKMYGVRVHPLLLARQLTGPNRELVATSYYSGIHDPDINQYMYDLVRRRHTLMSETGVEVHERTLHYLWEWRVDDGSVPRPWYDDAPERAKAKVKRQRVAREKGVDVALSLDAVAALLTDVCDVAIVVSRDRDLMEIATEIHQRCHHRPRHRVEVAYVSERRGDEKPLSGYDAQIEITESIVHAARDDFDYSNDLDPGAVTAFLTKTLG